MRKIIIAACSMVIGIIANAQTEKGDWLVGGRVDVNTGENSTQLAFNPGAGYFFARNFAAGGNFMINYVKSGDLKTTTFGFGPFARYYFTQANAKPLVHGAFNYISAKVKAPGNTSITNNGSNFLLAGGVALFINENVAVEILAGYSHTKYKDFEGSGGFNLGIGFQVYLSKRQVESVTK